MGVERRWALGAGDSAALCTPQQHALLGVAGMASHARRRKAQVPSYEGSAASPADAVLAAHALQHREADPQLGAGLLRGQVEPAWRSGGGGNRVAGVALRRRGGGAPPRRGMPAGRASPGALACCAHHLASSSLVMSCAITPYRYRGEAEGRHDAGGERVGEAPRLQHSPPRRIQWLTIRDFLRRVFFSGRFTPASGWWGS